MRLEAAVATKPNRLHHCSASVPPEYHPDSIAYHTVPISVIYLLTHSPTQSLTWSITPLSFAPFSCIYRGSRATFTIKSLSQFPHTAKLPVMSPARTPGSHSRLALPVAPSVKQSICYLIQEVTTSTTFAVSRASSQSN